MMISVSPLSSVDVVLGFGDSVWMLHPFFVGFDFFFCVSSPALELGSSD
jgi:hypothetical protein